MKIEVNTHERCMIAFAQKHPEVLVLSADLGSSCEVKLFRSTFPDRYLTMGIAEQNMCSWAAGLAREGYRPFLHTFSVFLYRRILDQLEMSVAYPNLPVVFVGFVPGITTPGGVSHQSINDVGVLRTVPNMTIFDIGDATEIEGVLDLAYEQNGPVYIRMLRKEVPRLFPADEPMQFNRARTLSEGDDVLILSSSVCTEEAIRATGALKERGLSVKHMHVSTLKPFTDPQILDSLKNCRYGVVTIENHYEIGGLGSAVAEMIADHGLGTKLKRVAIPSYTHGASRMYLMKKYGIDAMSLVRAVEELTGKDLGITEDFLLDTRFVDFLEV